MVSVETRAAVTGEIRAPSRSRKSHKVGRHQTRAAYLLLSPALILYVAFIAVPLVALVVVMATCFVALVAACVAAPLPTATGAAAKANTAATDSQDLTGFIPLPPHGWSRG